MVMPKTDLGLIESPDHQNRGGSNQDGEPIGVV